MTPHEVGWLSSNRKLIKNARNTSYKETRPRREEVVLTRLRIGHTHILNEPYNERLRNVLNIRHELQELSTIGSPSTSQKTNKIQKHQMFAKI